MKRKSSQEMYHLFRVAFVSVHSDLTLLCGAPREPDLVGEAVLSSWFGFQPLFPIVALAVFEATLSDLDHVVPIALAL